MRDWPDAPVILADLYFVARADAPPPTPPIRLPTNPAENYSGYVFLSFCRIGECVHLTVEYAGRWTGFISRYGGGFRERSLASFVDHFFHRATIEGTN